MLAKNLVEKSYEIIYVAGLSFSWSNLSKWTTKWIRQTNVNTCTGMHIYSSAKLHEQTKPNSKLITQYSNEQTQSSDAIRVEIQFGFGVLHKYKYVNIYSPMLMCPMKHMGVCLWLKLFIYIWYWLSSECVYLLTYICSDMQDLCQNMEMLSKYVKEKLYFCVFSSAQW